MSDAASSEANEGLQPIGRARIARNMAFNWAGMACEAVVGFLLLPLLVSRLGDTGYGLWVVIGSLTGFFQLMDLGMRGSVGRFVALYRAHNDVGAINRTISTSFTLLSVIGVLAAVVVLALSFVFPSMVEVPPELAGDVRLAFILVALNLGLWFVFQGFDAILWGYQRFDLLNCIDVPTAFLRLALCYVFVTPANGLWALAAITLGCTLLVGFAKGLAAFAIDRRLTIRVRFADFSAVRELFGYGVWNFVAYIALLARKSLIPLVIGAVLSPATVTLYAIARRLVDYAGMFLMVAAGVLTPVAAGNHARDDDHRQRRLLLVGTKYFNCLVLYFVIGMGVLGGAFIRLWVGEKYDPAAALVVILLLGEALGLANYVVRSVLLGAARHQSIAWLSVIDAIVAVGGGAVAAWAYGLAAACIVSAASSFVFTGVALAVYGCRLLKVGGAEYLSTSWVPALIAAIGPTVLLGIVAMELRLNSWLAFVAAGIAFTCAWVVSGLIMFAEFRVAPSRWKSILRS